MWYKKSFRTQIGRISNQSDAEELQSVREIHYALYAAILQHKDSFSVAWENVEERTDRENLRRFLFLVLAEYPKAFYVSWEKSSIYFYDKIAQIRLWYIFSKEECRTLQKEIKKKVSYLCFIAKCLCGQCKEKRIRYLYQYFVIHISYAEELLHSENEQELCRIHSAVGALLDGRAVCDGVARGFKLVLDELGIENRIIRRNLQKSAEFSHEWNVIVLNGEELHVDITWEMDVYNIQNRMLFEFFLLPEKEMQKKHQKGKNQECFKKRDLC